MILFILQNAYTSVKHRFTNNIEWSRELSLSHTGRRLKEMIPNGMEFKVINASKNIGDNPNSSFKADIKHIKQSVTKIKPTIICAYGKIAQEGCIELDLFFIKAPHPAWRQLSKKQTGEIRDRIIALDKSSIL
jgi:hypothetical protein